MKILKCLLMIVTAPVILALTLFVWLCTGLIYISGLVLGLLSTVIALLGVAVLITYSPQNGAILLIMAFLISPMGLPLAAIWLLGKVQRRGAATWATAVGARQPLWPRVAARPTRSATKTTRTRTTWPGVP